MPLPTMRMLDNFHHTGCMTDNSWRNEYAPPKMNISLNLPKIEPVTPLQLNLPGLTPKKKKSSFIL